MLRKGGQWCPGVLRGHGRHNPGSLPRPPKALLTQTRDPTGPVAWGRFVCGVGTHSPQFGPEIRETQGQVKRQLFGVRKPEHLRRDMRGGGRRRGWSVRGMRERTGLSGRRRARPSTAAGGQQVRGTGHRACSAPAACASLLTVREMLAASCLPGVRI